MKAKRVDLTSGPITKKLILFALPIIFSNLLQHFYSAADRIVVGQFAEDGTTALAAVGATGSAITLLLGLFSGLSIGVNIICANARGARNMTGLRQTMHTAPLIALICGVFMMIVGVLVSRPMLVLMSAPEDVLDQATLYMRIYFLGVPASLMYNFGSAIVRSNGDTKRPMMILAFSGLVNIALNLVLVVIFHLDVAGVAIATIAAQYLSAFQIWRILFNPKDDYKMKVKELRLDQKQVISIIRVGVPCGINGIAFSISNMIMQSAINGFNDPILMAGNVASDGLTGLIYQVIVGFYSAVVSFSGQNYGAGNYKRIDKALISSLLWCCGTVLVLGVGSVIFHEPLMGLFNPDKEVIAAGTTKLQVFCYSYVIYGVSELLLGCLRGMKESAIPSAINFTAVCVFRVVWVLLIFPMNGDSVGWLYTCYPVSYILSTLGMFVYFLMARHKFKKKLKAAA